MSQYFNAVSMNFKPTDLGRGIRFLAELPHEVTGGLVNRPINNRKARYYSEETLLRKIAKISTISLLLVNGVYYILDGQHRIMAVQIFGQMVAFDNVRIYTLDNLRQLGVRPGELAEILGDSLVWSDSHRRNTWKSESRWPQICEELDLPVAGKISYVELPRIHKWAEECLRAGELTTYPRVSDDSTKESEQAYWKTHDPAELAKIRLTLQGVKWMYDLVMACPALREGQGAFSRQMLTSVVIFYRLFHEDEGFGAVAGRIQANLNLAEVRLRNKQKGLQRTLPLLMRAVNTEQRGGEVYEVFGFVC